MAQSKTYIDLDLFAETSYQGRIRESINGDALKESLRFFISTKGGDILGFPSDGGILDLLQFRSLNEEQVQGIRMQLIQQIQSGFSPEVDIQELIVEPDYERRTLNLTLVYVNPITLMVDEVTNYYTLNIPQQKTIDYVVIEYVGENLLNFCVTQKPGNINERLSFNAMDGKFYYGKFKFINLEQSDPYFIQILELLNS